MFVKVLNSLSKLYFKLGDCVFNEVEKNLWQFKQILKFKILKVF